jgi:hypothetical protein
MCRTGFLCHEKTLLHDVSGWRAAFPQNQPKPNAEPPSQTVQFEFENTVWNSAFCEGN